MTTTVRAAALLLLGGAGCGADEAAEGEDPPPVLQAINGSVSEVQGLVVEGDLRVAVVWFGQHETTPVGAGRLTVAQDIAAGSGLPERFSLELTTPPPDAAVVRWEDARADIRQWWPEGSRWALGALLAYEDVNANGALDLIDHDDPAPVDRVVGAKPDFVIGWAEGGLPAIPFIRGEVKEGYNLFKVTPCMFSPRGADCGEGEEEMVVLNDDVLLELEPVAGAAFNYMMCAAADHGDAIDRTGTPLPMPDEWTAAGSFPACSPDGTVTLTHACGERQSLCFGERRVCEVGRWAPPSSDAGAERLAWPCDIAGWCDDDAVRNPCEADDLDVLSADEPEAAWLASSEDAFWWATQDAIRTMPRDGGGEPTTVAAQWFSGGWFAFDDTHVWFTGAAMEGSVVGRAPLAGGEAEVVHTHDRDVAKLGWLTTHEGGAYWLTQTADHQTSVSHWRPGAQAPTVIATSEGRFEGLVIHDGRLWSKDWGSGGIGRMALDGSGQEQVLDVGHAGGYLAAIDGGFAYGAHHADDGIFHQLFKVSLDSGEVEHILNASGGWLNAIRIEPDGLWWGDNWGGRIGRGAAVVRRAPDHNGFVVLEDRLCWPERTAGRVVCAPR